MGAGSGRLASEVLMRHARNFNPEWGYLAPAPSFMRTARIVVVAAAVGASAGAAVVFSLVDRPTAEESVAARTLARPVASAPAAVTMPAAAQVQAEEQGRSPTQLHPTAQSTVLRQSAANAGATSPAASDSSASSTTQRPASSAALAEYPAATDAPPAAASDAPANVASNSTPTQKKAPKKHRYVWRNEQGYGRGPVALLPSYGDRGMSMYAPRDEYYR